MPESELPDGLVALRAQLDLPQIMRLIEHTARWVDPATFRLLPLWYPEYARGTFFYKNNWSEPQTNTNRQTKQTEHKREGNVHAARALTNALGYRGNDRPNWSCCHIWGIDDDKYQNANTVVQDPRYFSCVANMVLLPSPLKAFTDAMVEVKAMLRICARHLYGWDCGHAALADARALLDGWHEWDAYPSSWPRKRGDAAPKGMVALNPTIRDFAARRLARIRDDLEHAGEFYPRASVRDTLRYWKISL
jgi:hypothetical protein